MRRNPRRKRRVNAAIGIAFCPTPFFQLAAPGTGVAPVVVYEPDVEWNESSGTSMAGVYPPEV
jgi:hypothetical protein